MNATHSHGATVLAGLALLGLGLGVAGGATPPTVTPLGSYRLGLTAPARVAADAGGRLYVTEPAAGRIVVYDPFGRISAVREGFAEPLAIAVDAAGRIVVSDARRGCVSVYDAAWTLLYELGQGDGEFLLPGFVALDPETGRESVWVSDGAANQVRVYTNGVLAFAFGSAGTGPGQFNFPAGLVVGSNEVAVVDQHNDRINLFTRAGSFLRALPLEVAGGRALGLAGDRAGRLYVADTFQGVVHVLDAAGTNLANVGVYGDLVGQLRTPVAATVDPLGRLYVVSPNNGRVELYGLDAFFHLTASPPGSLLATGATCTLAVIAGGVGPFTYRWLQGTNMLSDDNNLTGATGAVLSVASVGVAQAGDYTVEIGGPTGTFTSGVTRLAVLTPPMIGGGPDSQTVAEGAHVAFAATAQGDALTYQWLHDGLPLEGATNTMLEFSAAQPEDAGIYTVAARNAVGEATSAPALLQVLRLPVIVLQPLDQRAVRGNPASFDVAAEGDNLAYQWRRNGTNIAAGTDALLLLPNVQPAAEGAYDVLITNAIGAVTSVVAAIQVLLPPTLMAIASIAPQAGSNMLVQFLVDPGATYAVDSSFDLTSWTRRTNVTIPAGSFEYLDPDTASQTQNFYRLRWIP